MQKLQTKAVLITFTLFLLGLIWVLLIRDPYRRISYTEDSATFTTKVEDISDVECVGIGDFANDAICLEVSFLDPTDETVATSEINSLGGLSNFTSNLEVNDLIRVNRVEVPQIEDPTNIPEDVVDLEADGASYYITGFDRINSYFIMISIFILLVVGFTGVKGVKSLLSLGVSLLIIVYVIVPLTMKGYDPILVSSLIGFFMFSTLIVITNGFNKFSLLSIGGASIGITATIIFTLLFSSISNLSGTGEEEAGMLATMLDVDIDILGIVMASFILGVFGVADDASVSQVYTVAEIKRSSPKESVRNIYTAAMRVGSSHIGSLINTLLLAYVASSFALFILLNMREQNIIDLLSADLLAEEIVRTIVGSIGLVITIPATTFLASRLLKEKDVRGIDHEHAH